jgi:hypothetical protein
MSLEFILRKHSNPTLILRLILLLLRNLLQSKLKDPQKVIGKNIPPYPCCQLGMRIILKIYHSKCQINIIQNKNIYIYIYKYYCALQEVGSILTILLMHILLCY